jgi:hypothetical protein
MIRRVIPLPEQVDRTLTSERITTTLCSLFSVLALVLAAVGLCGVMSYAMVSRQSFGVVGLALASTRLVAGFSTA